MGAVSESAGPCSANSSSSSSSSTPIGSPATSPTARQLSAYEPRHVLWRVVAPTLNGQGRSPRPGWQAVYWKQQVASCRTYDFASCALKVSLLLGNVRRSVHHGEVHAARCAAGAALLVFLSLLLMLLCQSHFVRYRRLVMWSNLLAISIMMASSMPQFLSATSSRLWGHSALVLLFKMGVTWPMMAALMHRLPWQDLAILCGTFCVWLCITWVRPLCTHLHSSKADAALVTSLAAVLDRVTGLGMDAAALGALDGSSSAGAGISVLGSQVKVLPSVAGAGAADSFWAPVAHHISAACIPAATGMANVSSSSSSILLSGPDCESLLMGQCLAVVTTFTVWVGVLVILFCVVLAEQHSKWRWWHSSGSRWQGHIPQVYAHASVWRFLGTRLLYLHILLDVPLMLLWVGASSLYRQPIAGLGGYNLW